MKFSFYKELYIAEDNELVSEDIKDKALVWVSKHWDWIYNTKPKTCNSETLQNYTLIFCESNDEFETLDSKLDSQNVNIFDYSFEFEYPSLLIETEYLNLCLR